MTVERTIGNRQGRIQIVLPYGFDDLALLLQIATFSLLETPVSASFFSTGNQFFISALRLAQMTAELFDASQVLPRHALVTVEHQTQGQGTQPQNILTHFTQAQNAGQPVFIYLLRLLVHFGHLQQRKAAEYQHQQRHQAKAQRCSGRNIQVS